MKFAPDDRQSVGSDAELEQFLCEMCKGISPPNDHWVSKVTQLFRTIFWKVGFGWEVPRIPDDVKSLHDIVAHLLLDAEVVRATREWPALAGVVTEERCFPFSLLAGRCVLVTNVATQ